MKLLILTICCSFPFLLYITYMFAFHDGWMKGANKVYNIWKNELGD